jgi:quercetin 2,3-dioxygenase
MLWSRDVPRCTFTDGNGKATEVTVIAGELDGKRAPPPPPHSWAARPDTDVAIWTIRMEAGATWKLPPAKNPEAVRTLYFFVGSSLRLAGEEVREHAGLVVESDDELPLEAGESPVELLMLQGRPIGEPVVQYGPFVMNRREEIERAMIDYRETRFGGWPWPSEDPVHARDAGRFAKHADGRIEKIED